MQLKAGTILLATCLLCACGGGSSSSSSDAVGAGAGSGSGGGGGSTAMPTAELANLNPTQVGLEVEAGEQESFAVSFRNAGGADLTYEVTTSHTELTLPSNASGSLASDGQVSLTIQATCDGSDFNASLTLTTNDADQSSVAIPVSVTCTAPVPSPYGISRVLLNQATRAFDSEVNDSPAIQMVAGRDLLVRAFVTGPALVPNAVVRVTQADASVQDFPMLEPAAVGPTAGDDTILSASHYVVVPGAAMRTGATLSVRVDDAEVVFPEAGPLALDVVDVGTVRITFVPVTFEGRTPSLNAAYLNQTLQQMPIGDYDLEIRSPYVFAGPFDLDELLDDMVDLRNLDGSDRLYHGIIDAPPSSGSTTGGIGFVGYPVSVSVDLGGTQNIISHEIGHNLNLSHAPACSAPNPDTEFPRPNGSVAQWGYNILSGRW